jgi:hypothetical protein
VALPDRSHQRALGVAPAVGLACRHQRDDKLQSVAGVSYFLERSTNLTSIALDKAQQTGSDNDPYAVFAD